MAISELVLNGVLDTEFSENDAVYGVQLLYQTGEGASSIETIVFDGADGGAVNLTSSVFFAVPSGKNVTKVIVWKDATEVLIEEVVDPVQEFTANGTYTVNNVIVTLAEV